MATETNTDTSRPPEWLALSFPDPLEQDELERLAGWCYQYSSQVCVARERTHLLLEVAASRRLFGSARGLAGRIVSELGQLGYRAASGIAPTPEAARVAARHGLYIPGTANICKRLGALGIDSLGLQAASILALHRMGFRTAAEVFRLPRKALARRLGPGASDYLDRLLGQRPDPRAAFRPADSFSAGMDLPGTENAQGLVFPLKRLVQELCGVLRARDRGIQALQLELRLARETRAIHLNLRQATRSEDHLVLLLRERLERLQLTCPVQHMRLQALQFLPCAAVQAGLLPAAADAPPTSAPDRLVERLQARLGKGCVKGITGRQDHRPEHSWALREPEEPATCSARPGRPAWLFAEPRACRIDDYRILMGPERIESGWWDGEDCRRDYFVVRHPDGSTLWAFHEYKPRPGWYLHGLFS